MNKDYLSLIAIGIIALMIRMYIPVKMKGESFATNVYTIALHLMILLGVAGIVLLIIDLF